MSPRDFWRLSPLEFWWLFDARRPGKMYGSMQESEVEELYADFVESGVLKRPQPQRRPDG